MIKLRPHHVEIIIKEFKDNFRKWEAWMFYHSTACPEELHWLTNPFYARPKRTICVSYATTLIEDKSVES